ncbi:xanthine dehydrogenase family protein molybdopterin-binding subunit [Lichenibacterium ramalinae]|uniref:Xanthine dehydrogenase family protein molybdopterin-binding subunit n=1 Tax=Lichenibacterium ramalinae TaxID=2316527 RepID=A0A4V1RIY9_9HYPH|nr:molybdopterin cofactor-binding domain-containing protein [Lichenibacterium ramalinae]RYB06291.1 xanthine dehydrogenase family protein molybdopterin-binding subunit [Lichenibacterium ramalinae]
MTAPLVIDRRTVLRGTGALVLGFALRPVGAAEAAEPAGEGGGATGPRDLPGSLKTTPLVDSWIRVAADGNVEVLTGKAELGQGIATALVQLAAEELDLPLARVTIRTADTATTADEGYTAGSHSMQDSGSAIRAAAAEVRGLLVGEAATRWAVPAEALRVEGGAVLAPDGRRFGFGDLVSATLLHVEATPHPALKPPGRYAVVGQAVPRRDIPAKVTGGAIYVQDLRPAGMVHARVIRPPAPGARLQSLDDAAVRATPGVVAVVRDGDFLAVAAETEWGAVEAMRRLAAAARWSTPAASLPTDRPAGRAIRALPARDTVILDRGAPPAGDGLRRFASDFTRPYQAHGSIGPSCAVAHLDGDTLTVWTHTQGVFPDRAAIAEMLGFPPARVRCIHTQGSGCYGHNGADDAAGDAALVARALPGRPVRLQLMREQEAAWEPFGPAMLTRAEAALDADGRIADWSYGVWSNTHNMRPGGAGALLAARLLAKPFAPPEPKPIPQPEGGGDRNAIPLYALPNARVTHHFVPDMPLRVSAMRALGAYANVFSIESFMDELARASAQDPIAFRLRHLDDPRARDVVARARDEAAWTGRPRVPGRGRGFAFARYKNLAAYCAVAVEVEVDRDTGRLRLARAVAAVDGGQVVNPDGLRNQIEGAILQSMSWTLYEEVGFDAAGVTSVDWATYPILRFDAVPDTVEVHLVDRPGQPFLGCGECGQGPTAAAIANAVADATGARLRDLPLTRERVLAALAV